MAKALVIIGDGMAGRPVKELGGKTCLEAAQRPHLDRVAREGECGLLDPIAPGVRVGSDTSHLALLGYNPFECYTGRGPFEALGIGMEVKPGDIAFRCNFATVDENFVVKDRRAGRIREGTDKLAQALNEAIGEIEGVKCIVKESVEHRAALILRGEGLGDKVNDVDPHEVGERIHEAVGEDEASRRTAKVLNEFVRRSYEVLKDHPVNKEREEKGQLPANILLPRGAGMAPHLEPFEKRHGLKGALVAEVGLIKGIGRYLDMTVPDVEGATGSHDTDVEALARATLEMLRDHDFVLVNLKAPDVGGHDQDPQTKVRDIELVDRLVGLILEGVDLSQTYIAVTADHSTPITVGDHSGDPTPIAIVGPDVRVDDVTEFTEQACAKGAMGRIRGMDLMNILTNLMAVQEKFGA